MINFNEVKLFYSIIISQYAEIKNKSVELTVKEFIKNHVYENILLYYELFSSLETEDLLIKIDNILKTEQQIFQVYHGSNMLFDEINLNKSKGYRDFGNGFYCTLLIKQAEKWAYIMKDRRNFGTPLLYTFNLELSKELKIKKFIYFDEEWIDFVVKNRTSKETHDYDIVIGPIADDNVSRSIRDYINKKLTKYELLKILQYRELNNQISIHTEKALNYLKLIDRSEINETKIKTNIRL